MFFYPIIILFSSIFLIKTEFLLWLNLALFIKYSCGQCPATYIGETQMQLKVRISQHKGISYRTDVPYSAPTNSSIRDHALNSDHPILNSNFKIIDRCSKIIESVNIHKHSPDLNEQASCFPLSILR